MKIDGWDYSFENLPHWGIRERFPMFTTNSPSLHLVNMPS